MPNLLTSRFLSGPNDNLAVQDIYNILESNFAPGVDENVVSEIQSALAQGLRIAESSFPQFVTPAANFVQDVLSTLKTRVDNFLQALPFDLRSLLSPGSMNFTMEDLGFAQLDMVWNYLGQVINIPPFAQRAYAQARAALGHLRNTGNVARGDGLGNAIDQGAQILVYSRLFEELIGVGINPPIKELIDGLANDEVRRLTSEKIIPTAINPNGNPDGPNPRQANFIPNENTPINTGGFQPKENIAPEFRDREKDRVDGDVWGRRETQPSTNPNRPNWTEKPEDDYLNEFAPKKTGVQEGDPIELAPGVRDNVIPGGETTRTKDRGFDDDLVNTLIDYTSPEQLVNRYPGMLGMVLYYYQLPDTDYDLGDEYHRIINLMNKLRPEWAVAQRNNKEIGNLLHFAKASLDAIYVLSSFEESEYRDAVLIAKSYPNNDVIQLLKAQYPLAAV